MILTMAIVIASITASLQALLPIKISDALSFTSYDVEKRKTKRLFLKQIGALIPSEV